MTSSVERTDLDFKISVALKQSYDKQNLTLMIISSEIYETPKGLFHNFIWKWPLVWGPLCILYETKVLDLSWIGNFCNKKKNKKKNKNN